MAYRPLAFKKPAVQPAGAVTNARKPATARRAAGRVEPDTRTATAESGVYLPLASNSKVARSHRVLAPTLKPTRVSEEDIAEAVRNFHRS